MRAEPLQTETLDHWRFGLETGVRGVGAAAARRIRDDQLPADLGVDALRMGGERAGDGSRLQRRTVALEDELDLRRGQQLVLDALAQFLLDAVQVFHAQHPDVQRAPARAGGIMFLTMPPLASVQFALKPIDRVGQIAVLQDLVRELVDAR